MKVYCAGKIRANDWRHHLLDQHTLWGENELYGAGLVVDEGWYDGNSLPERWPILSIGKGYQYTGPYFLQGSHGDMHGNNKHGVGIETRDDGSTEYGEEVPADRPRSEKYQRKVVSLCQQAIEISDAVFVWMGNFVHEQETAFGTLAEIGYAAAFNKKIYIAGSVRSDNLWFAYAMAHKVMISDLFNDNCIPTIIRELHLDLNKMPYKEYLQTEHWEVIRREIGRRWGKSCSLCRSNQNVAIHHRSYENRGCEQSNDLIALCATCHAKFHDKLPKGAK